MSEYSLGEKEIQQNKYLVCFMDNKFHFFMFLEKIHLKFSWNFPWHVSKVIIFKKLGFSKIRISWKNSHPCLLLPPIVTHLQWREYEGSGVHALCSTWSPGGARAGTRRRRSWGPRCRSWGSPPSCRAPRAGSGNGLPGREEKTKKQGFLITTILCQNFLNGFYCKIRILKEEC